MGTVLLHSLKGLLNDTSYCPGTWGAERFKAKATVHQGRSWDSSRDLGLQGAGLSIWHCYISFQQTQEEKSKSVGSEEDETKQMPTWHWPRAKRGDLFWEHRGTGFPISTEGKMEKPSLLESAE